MDCVNSYWLNWIKWNEYCENDSIEIVRSVFIWNMWFVDSSMKNQSCIVKIQSENGFNKHKEGKISQYLNSEHNPFSLKEYDCCLYSDYTMLIPHWLASMWLIDMDFYNKKEEDSYAMMFNDRLQIIQWSNTTTSCILFDSIAKLSENTVYFSDCSIWILSNRLHDIIHRLDIINESFYRWYIIDK